MELQTKTALLIWPIWPNCEANGLDWQCYLAGSSKTAPRILIFSIAICADYSFDIKSGFNIAPAFSLHNNFDIASVHPIRILFLCRWPVQTMAASGGVTISKTDKSEVLPKFNKHTLRTNDTPDVHSLNNK